ncbi:uncharacterized protein LTR77_005379 [Saxophila tyrrhenica]|uniref:Major facilitator superfamily (MFS) profile domain-containing protein n=1 Tax=Saxophila tyrrhenica TaxID=1690608 RepID=A0AAV9PBS5_9PEZI|nr:hypothetical protein LTR77_005379 [Saxophila tyrrhenica]
MQSLLQIRRIRHHVRKQTQATASVTRAPQKEKIPTSNEPASVGHPALHTTVSKELDNTSEDKSFQVGFGDPNDPIDPQNWPSWMKFGTNIMTASVACIAGFASSIDSPLISQAAAEFRVSEEAESLATVLFLVGFGVGAPFASPLSETFGRNPIYIGTLALFCCWILGSALSPNFGAQLVFRFLAGFFGSTAFTTAGGTLGDVFSHEMRSKIFPWFGAVALFGPMIAPVVGGYVGESVMDWRWAD